MAFFTYHLPPFLDIMGGLYIVVSLAYLLRILKDGYCSKVHQIIYLKLINNFYRLILITLSVILIIAILDLPITQLMHKLDVITHSYTFWDFISSCSEGNILCGILIMIIILSEFYNFRRLAIITKISLSSLLYTSLINLITKIIFSRQRPSVGLDPWHFFAFLDHGPQKISNFIYAYNSMPSGHTISISAIIIPFFLAYKNLIFRSGLIFLLCLVAFARVYTINHWFSDTVVAAILGVTIGQAIYYANLSRLKNVS